jgi:hypothetical protein
MAIFSAGPKDYLHFFVAIFVHFHLAQFFLPTSERKLAYLFFAYLGTSKLHGKT